MITPKFPELHDLAVDFCQRELTEDVNLSQYSKVFIAAETENDRPVSVEGVTGYVMRPDISLFRAISARATAKLHHRWHTFFADSGILGQEVLLYLSSKETPEQRCASWEEQLKAAQAIPADRFLIKVRAM